MKPHPQLDAAEEGQVAVRAKWAAFAWQQDLAPVLHDITLEAIKGQLVIAIGVVGSGKSSLLAGLLGELHPRGGLVEVSMAIPLCRVYALTKQSLHVTFV